MISATIITGFLGSGKTSLLNRLLKHPLAGNSLVVINEFGEIGIDHLIVSAPAENVRLLANGCICCQTKGHLVETLTDLSRKRERAALPAFERIFIETTGLADPVPIVHAIVNNEDLSAVYRLDRVIAVVDAVHLHSQLSRYEEARKQVAVADVVLLSKTDLVERAELAELEAAVKRINAGADVFPVAHGSIEAHRLLDASAAAAQRDVARWLETTAAERHAAGGLPHLAGISTFCASLEDRISAAGLATWLSMLASFKGLQLLRVKGIVNVAGEPYVVDVVQSVVHPPFKLDAWPTPDERTRIVFIVRGLMREAIEATFSAFALGDSLPGARAFDAAAYARFRAVANQFVDLKDVVARERG
ncbi:MAG: GTP-binding protein [Betaproteobacteria bacterium]|nr:MAG: GTP-binding protein [Betaproteobacteria bacterium]